MARRLASPWGLALLRLLVRPVRLAGAAAEWADLAQALSSPQLPLVQRQLQPQAQVEPLPVVWPSKRQLRSPPRRAE
jgi:hypothetical protein